MATHHKSPSLGLGTIPIIAEGEEICSSRKRQSAVGCGLKTDSSLFETVTSAFYSYSSVLNTTEIAVWDLSNDFDDRMITYQDLASRVQDLARHLDSFEVKSGWKIPLVATRGLESVVAILAVLSCGAQFIPIDYEIRSREYLRKTVEWSKSNLVLSVSPLTDDILSRVFAAPSPVRVIGVHSINSRSPESNDDRNCYFNKAKAEDVCYTVFTSGMNSPPPRN